MKGLSTVPQIINAAVAGSTAEKFSEAGALLVKVRNDIREEVQTLTSAVMKPIIQKLEKNESLTAEEKELIRLWVVGDAEGFAKLESEYREWLKEFQRIGDLVKAQEGKPATLPELLDLYGLLEEGVRLAADIQFFLEEKERGERFTQAVKNLNEADAKMLADILKEKLTSPEF